MTTDYSVITRRTALAASVAEIVEGEVVGHFAPGLDEDRIVADVAERELQHAEGPQLEQAVRRGRPELVERRAARADDVLTDAELRIPPRILILHLESFVQVVVAVDHDVEPVLEEQLPDIAHQ